MNSLLLRIYLTGKSVVKIFSLLPIRLIRLFLHFFQWLPQLKTGHLPSKNVQEWIVDLCFYIADVVLLPDLFEMLFTLVTPKIRLLNKEEKHHVGKYFNSKVKVDNIRMSPRLPFFVDRQTMALVTFNTIHFRKEITVPIFIHEVVHIWQYQKFGSVYIYRALKAQRSVEGYNYGGLESLYSKMLSNFTFTEFNFEQQGEIFEDFCRLLESEQIPNPIAHASYEYFVGQVKEGRVT